MNKKNVITIILISAVATILYATLPAATTTETSKETPRDYMGENYSSPAIDELTANAILEDEFDDNICQNYSGESFSKLPVDAIFEMVNQYKGNQLNFASEPLQIDDAQVIWFDLVTLKEFLYHIEQETRSNDRSISDKDLGVHIYYAGYTNDPAYNERTVGLDSEYSVAYAKRHTLIMVPTIRKDKINYDFDPENRETYDAGFTSEKLKKEYAKESQRKILSLGKLKATDQNQTPARNHGGLFPPGNMDGLHFIESSTDSNK